MEQLHTMPRETIKKKGPAGAANTHEAEANAKASADQTQDTTWLYPGQLADLTPIQQETLRLSYQAGGWDALLDANGNALRTLVERGLVRRVQSARDPVTDRRARAFHDTYERNDRELYWRFALTPEGRAIAEAAWGVQNGKSKSRRRA